MDTGIIITGIVLTALLISPFVFFRDTKRKSREKDMLNALNALAAKSNSEVGEHECWNNSIIGIDKQLHWLFFSVKREEKSTEKVVNLADVKRCKVSVKNHNVGFKHQTQTVTDSISLVFEFRQKEKSDVYLEFYNDDYDGLTLNGEIQLAEKWSERINASLVSLNHQKRA
jgi:hypothetical protein